MEDLLAEMSGFPADVLLMYWCGHGVLHHQRRALFTSDAYEHMLRSIAVPSIQSYLASARVDYLTRQILVIDSCANYYSDMNTPDAVADEPSFTIGGDRPVSQLTVYSASQGQIARFDQSIHHGSEFSRAVIEWLGTQPGRLQLDGSDLAGHVMRRFELLRQQPGFGQRPTTCLIESTDSEPERWTYPGSVTPVPGEVFADLQAMNLTVTHTQRATTALAGLTALGSEAQVRAAMAEVLSDFPTSGRDTHALVTKIFRTGRSSTLFELLSERLGQGVEAFALADVRLSWERQEAIAAIESNFGTVTTKQITDSYARAGGDLTDGYPVDLSEALDRLDRYPEAADGFTRLQRFLATLECATRTAVPDIVFRLPFNRLKGLREQARRESTEPTRMVIEIPDQNTEDGTPGGTSGERFAWPSQITCYRYAPGIKWHSTEVHACEPSPDGVAAVVNRLMAGESQNCALGFIVPREVFDAVPEAWPFVATHGAPVPHWRYRPTVLHCAERRKRKSHVRLNWLEKHQAITTRLENFRQDLAWIPVDLATQLRALVRDSESTCFGIDFVPDTVGPSVADPLITMITAGAPFIIWTARPEQDWSRTKDLLDKLVTDRPFERMPVRLQQWRENNCHAAADHVRLIWDDPAILPPAPKLPGMT